MRASAHLFRRRVVLHAECGAGVLSVLAAMEGARRVYCVERSAGRAALARRLAADNGVAGKVVVVEGDIRRVALPVAEVDVVLAHWGAGGDPFTFGGSFARSVLYARDRYLSRERGVMFPDRISLHATAVRHAGAAALARRRRRARAVFRGMETRALGDALGREEDRAVRRRRRAGHPFRVRVGAGDVVSSASSTLRSFDLERITLDELRTLVDVPVVLPLLRSLSRSRNRQRARQRAEGRGGGGGGGGRYERGTSENTVITVDAIAVHVRSVFSHGERPVVFDPGPLPGPGRGHVGGRGGAATAAAATPTSLSLLPPYQSVLYLPRRVNAPSGGVLRGFLDMWPSEHAPSSTAPPSSLPGTARGDHDRDDDDDYNEYNEYNAGNGGNGGDVNDDLDTGATTTRRQHTGMDLQLRVLTIGTKDSNTGGVADETVDDGGLLPPSPSTGTFKIVSRLLKRSCSAKSRTSRRPLSPLTLRKRTTPGRICKQTTSLEVSGCATSSGFQGGEFYITQA